MGIEYVSYEEALNRRRAAAKKELSRLNKIHLNSDVDISEEVEACLEELDMVYALIKTHEEVLKLIPSKD